jgi:hypothetical protein
MLRKLPLLNKLTLFNRLPLFHKLPALIPRFCHSKVRPAKKIPLILKSPIISNPPITNKIPIISKDPFVNGFLLPNTISPRKAPCREGVHLNAAVVIARPTAAVLIQTPVLHLSGRMFPTQFRNSLSAIGAVSSRQAPRRLPRFDLSTSSRIAKLATISRSTLFSSL